MLQPGSGWELVVLNYGMLLFWMYASMWLAASCTVASMRSYRHRNNRRKKKELAKRQHFLRSLCFFRSGIIWTQISSGTISSLSRWHSAGGIHLANHRGGARFFFFLWLLQQNRLCFPPTPDSSTNYRTTWPRSGCSGGVNHPINCFSATWRSLETLV